MTYPKQMYGVFAFIYHMSIDTDLPSSLRRDLLTAANLVFDEKPLDALENLCKIRAIYAITKTDGTALIQASEAIAAALISIAKTLEDIENVKSRLGPWAKAPFISVLCVARSCGLKELAKPTPTPEE